MITNEKTTLKDLVDSVGSDFLTKEHDALLVITLNGDKMGIEFCPTSDPDKMADLVVKSLSGEARYKVMHHLLDMALESLK